MLSLQTSGRLVREITTCTPSYTVTYLAVIGDSIKSATGYLEKVINAGIHTVIYEGDADYICSYQGVEDMIDSLKHKYSNQYANTPWSKWTVDGVTAGQFKNAGSFSYVRIYGFVLCLPASHLKLTSLFPVLATWSPPTPSGTSHTEGMPPPCSTRR